MGYDLLREVLSKLRNFESMTWGEIEGGNSHFSGVGQLGRAAQKRLQAIRQDDVDQLFSLRLTGPQRVWGIRDGRVFSLLWWDPGHKVYPSKKKHT